MAHPVVAQSVCVGLYVQLAGRVDVDMVKVAVVLVLELEGVVVRGVLGETGEHPSTSTCLITVDVELDTKSVLLLILQS